jgi:hypothetical protein
MKLQILIGTLLALLCVGGISAQQPNTPGVASMTFAGLDGPPWPINVQFGSTVIGLEFQGTPGSPYALVSADNAQMFPAGIPTNYGLVDIDITGGLTFVLNGIAPVGFFDFLSVIGPTGLSNWTLPIAANGNWAMQSLMADPTSAFGFTLTAASAVNVQVAQNLFLAVPGGGDDVFTNITLSFGSTAFYDVVYPDLWASSNGCVTFAGGDAGPWAAGPGPYNTTFDFDAGYPRMAPLWTDLTPGIAISAGNFVLTFLETLDGWTCRWVGMNNYSDPAAGPSTPLNPAVNNTFSVSYNYTSNVTPTNPLGLAGSIVFDYSLPEPQFLPPFMGGVAANWGICGITPGGTVPSSSPVTPGSSTPLDPGTPVPFDPSIDPTGAPAMGGGISNAQPMASFRGVFSTTTTPFPFALLSGTGQQVIFFPGNFSPSAGVANTYQLL